jgi:hypothetical protein
VSVKREDLQFGTSDPVSNNTVDSLLRHQEVGQAKELPAPPHSKEEGNTKFA